MSDPVSTLEKADIKNFPSIALPVFCVADRICKLDFCMVYMVCDCHSLLKGYQLSCPTLYCRCLEIREYAAVEAFVSYWCHF